MTLRPALRAVVAVLYGMRMLRLLLSALAAFAVACRVHGDPAPAAVYLTWQRDPTTTMTVHWLSGDDDPRDEIALVSGAQDEPAAVTGVHRPMPGAAAHVHTVELTGLRPGGEYRFRIAGRDEEHRFRTMPADASRPITFIDAGDVYYRAKIDGRLYREAAKRDPMFAVIGGDIVYDNGELSRGDRWIRWLDYWQRNMVTSDGRLIPMIVAIGNHEVKGRYDRTPAEAPFFYALFASPGPRGYTVLDFGSYMSLIVLDTGHTNPIEGAQAQWLEQVLAERGGVPHLFAVYHVPSHPSARDWNDDKCPSIRRHWVPLFERFGLDVAFEHHDHAYKRTHPIRDGGVDAAGVVYLGDGGFGANLRRPHPVAQTWYLARAEKVHSFTVTTIHGESREHYAVDPDGQIVDGSGSLFRREKGSRSPSSDAPP